MMDDGSLGESGGAGEDAGLRNQCFEMTAAVSAGRDKAGGWASLFKTGDGREEGGQCVQRPGVSNKPWAASLHVLHGKKGGGRGIRSNGGGGIEMAGERRLEGR